MAHTQFEPYPTRSNIKLFDPTSPVLGLLDVMTHCMYVATHVVSEYQIIYFE
jgi:hypothetical protein